MSSFVRRIQKRLLPNKIPVLHPETGNVMTRLHPRRRGQLAYYGNPPRDIFADTKHETLQPIIDILADNARRTAA